LKHRTLTSVVVAAALLSFSTLSIAADAKTASSAPAKASASASASAAASVPASPKKTKAKVVAPKVKLVDINSAGKAELKKLPGVDDAVADKIIAGRPYLSKAHLVTRVGVPRDVYEQIKKQIIAIQKPAAKGK
jgi:DNA uptake protein ComE-like DNA-binding protein